MRGMRTVSVAMCCVAMTAAAAVPARAALSSECQAVTNAMLRVATTPHHAVATSSKLSGVTESIMAGDTNYFKYHGVWKKSPLSPKDNLEREQDNIKNARVYTCRRLPDELLDGASVAVYTAHSETADVGTTDAKLWISKATGLPLRTDSDIDVGTKQHLSVRYDYANIKPPIIPDSGTSRRRTSGDSSR
jgi:hypothetical protein